MFCWSRCTEQSTKTKGMKTLIQIFTNLQFLLDLHSSTSITKKGSLSTRSSRWERRNQYYWKLLCYELQYVLQRALMSFQQPRKQSWNMISTLCKLLHFCTSSLLHTTATSVTTYAKRQWAVANLFNWKNFFLKWASCFLFQAILHFLRNITAVVTGLSSHV